MIVNCINYILIEMIVEGVDGILIVLIVSSAITDIKHQKIYNHQTYSAMLLGLILNSIMTNNGLVFSLSGLSVCFALLFPFFLCDGMGAGDVKLLAAIGALKGTMFVMQTIYYAALIGGCMAVSLLIWQENLWVTVKNSTALLWHPIKTSKILKSENPQYLPFGVAISIGCAWVLIGG